MVVDSRVHLEDFVVGRPDRWMVVSSYQGEHEDEDGDRDVIDNVKECVGRETRASDWIPAHRVAAKVAVWFGLSSTPLAEVEPEAEEDVLFLLSICPDPGDK